MTCPSFALKAGSRPKYSTKTALKHHRKGQRLTRRVMMETKTLRKNTNREETGQDRADEKDLCPQIV
jgi:hypothetical protein